MENVPNSSPTSNTPPLVGKQEESVNQDTTAVATAPVLTEKNHHMISPVVYKLRKEGRRLTCRNPVDPVKVPSHDLLGFPTGRYMSPTDNLVSPVSRGLQARTRRSMRPPQALVPPKILDNTFQDAEPKNSNAC